jgi:hypothetical protein
MTRLKAKLTGTGVLVIDWSSRQVRLRVTATHGRMRPGDVSGVGRPRNHVHGSDRRTAHVCARLDLVGYHLRGGHWRIVRWFYAASQGRLHAWVGRRFLSGLRRVWAAGAMHGRRPPSGT